MMNKYSEIRKNLIDNFFNKNYRYTCVTCKNSVISDMKTRLPFTINYNINYNNTDVLDVNLGDNITLTFNLIWETKEKENKINKNMQSIYYRLVKIE